MREGITNSINISTGERTKAFVELLKPRLSFLVAFSSGFGYVLALNSSVNFLTLFGICFGGFLISGAAVIINQIKEKEFDALMKRTKNRPLPTAKVSDKEAYAFGGLVLMVGVFLLYLTANPLAILLSLISLVLYSYIYTPLKRVGPIAVFVGAFPGALPPLIGWVAATGVIGVEALVIFGIQFVWQFPHFWAIAWVADEDYKKAGFKLLPSGGKKDFGTAINIMIYTLFLLPLGLLPAYFGITGINSGVVATICGCGFLAQTFSLMRDHSDKAALKIMFGSFLYLPIVQIAYLLDKI